MKKWGCKNDIWSGKKDCERARAKKSGLYENKKPLSIMYATIKWTDWATESWNAKWVCEEKNIEGFDRKILKWFEHEK